MMEYDHSFDEAAVSALYNYTNTRLSLVAARVTLTEILEPVTACCCELYVE